MLRLSQSSDAFAGVLALARRRCRLARAGAFAGIDATAFYAVSGDGRRRSRADCEQDGCRSDKTGTRGHGELLGINTLDAPSMTRDAANRKSSLGDEA